MIRRKQMKSKGKIKFSRYFQELEENDRVSVERELAVQPKFPSKLQGRCGVVIGRRGDCYIVRMNDLNKGKTYIIHPLHLKKLNQAKAK